MLISHWYLETYNFANARFHIQLKKVRLYETVGDAVAPTFSLANIDQAPDSAFTGAQSSASVPTGKLVQKEDIIKCERIFQVYFAGMLVVS